MTLLEVALFLFVLFVLSCFFYSALVISLSWMLEKQISLLEAVSIEILLKQFEASETMSMSEHESVEDSVASNDLKYSLLKPFTLLLLFSA